MSNKYTLVNPHIGGSFKTTVKAKNSVKAANYFYTKLSEHFNNAIPTFHFSIQKGGKADNKFFHFQVNEKIKNKNVSFTLQPYNIVGVFNSSEFTDRLQNIKTKIQQMGGNDKSKSDKTKDDKTKDDKSSDSSSESSSDSSDLSISSDDYKRINTIIPSFNQPIYYWWYDPRIYKLNTYYIPTFYAYVTPIIEIVSY